MCSMDKVKDKIKKLLAMAADDANLDGEVKNAMALAEAAMEKYHLSRADVEAASQGTKETTQEVFVKEHSSGKGVRITQWEGLLARAIEKLIGSVGCYRESILKVEGAFGRSRSYGVITWYGPDEDVSLADELFQEWAAVISTLSIGKFDSFARGLGARYAYGFTSALYNQAKDHAEQRKVIVTPSTTALTVSGEGSLADLLAQKQRKGENWLSKKHGVTLVSRSGRSGYAGVAGGFDAYAEGKSDGRRANFEAARKNKLNCS